MMWIRAILQCFDETVKPAQRAEGGGHTDTQRALLSKARGGDSEAFFELVSPFSGMVYRHCLHMLHTPADAEDAAQEAMLRAYRSFPRFLGHSAVATWLYRIAHNTCLDMLKKPLRQRESASLEQLREAGFEPSDHREPPDVAYVLAADTQRLKNAISKLPTEQQALLNLRYGEGLSYEQLASTTGMREGTVKSRLNRAKARLRELLEND